MEILHSVQSISAVELGGVSGPLLINERPGHGKSDGSVGLAREFVLFVELVIDGVNFGILKLGIAAVDLCEPCGV